MVNGISNIPRSWNDVKTHHALYWIGCGNSKSVFLAERYYFPWMACSYPCEESRPLYSQIQSSYYVYAEVYVHEGRLYAVYGIYIDIYIYIYFKLNEMYRFSYYRMRVFELRAGWKLMKYHREWIGHIFCQTFSQNLYFLSKIYVAHI